MAVRIVLIALSLIAGGLFCADPNAETKYPDNTFRRVASSGGLKLMSGPDKDASVLVKLPFRVHVRLLRTRNGTIKRDGKKGRAAFISWSPMSVLKMPKTTYEGWTYTWLLEPALIEITPNLFRNFKAGCLGEGCFVCGSQAFDPDGRFHNSFDCHARPERGRWKVRGDVVLACVGRACDPIKKPLYRFRVREKEIIAECAGGKCSYTPAPVERVWRWEPHDFQ